ncbi:N-acetyl-gamma-glutamyl-phosphate reductase [Thalassobacillus sp. CUG 92003]|uniref:N-acetyl-gamma-glutamyl-phosphate reductase n=1 Tax=Thalassobacillus sp. CUG 92003 TaxID=2736641 RepID=UPI0015E7C53B|nr:N-acetyl-gamma-glutamyl-phosphate reductase [Thalassobacillus sp. CUG 92003]
MKIGIVGATGYGGAELYRLLSLHPNVASITLYSSSQTGVSYNEIYTHLYNVTDAVLHALEPEKMKKELDIIFLAAPAGVAAQLAPQLLGGEAKIIDLSGDLRIRDPEVYRQWYNSSPADAALLDQAVYGLSELNTKRVQQANLVANPGCYPTAVLVGVAPLVLNGLINNSSLIIDAKTGVSGAGKNPNPVTHFAATQENFRIYKVNRHQHTPEIEQQLHHWSQESAPITFSTHLAPMTRGIMATMYADLNHDLSYEDLIALYQKQYEHQPCVRLREKGEFPGTRDVYASNYCDISLELDQRTGRVMIVSVIDNLMKGAAGQAVQNMNIMFDYEETAGLRSSPVYP